ncbi:hypothetical protein IBL28_02715 [Sinomicrobium sp. FJxs]|uniref:Lipocalin-like domain-containing protein n=2 Tax=Sinomicrobium weinanense TaxID=2842200 RepID=A0A926JP27_9FLAO|nr:hypothetical protein [Sinomicrobium weinanense]MBU3125636.1 hypothetical protein [Sinomicrobium weinanense]
MKAPYLITIIIIITLQSCTTGIKRGQSSITGTWKLVSGMTIEGRDTVFTDYTKGQEMIKIINDSHFAFLRHDLNGGRDSTAIFVSGGGTYSLDGNTYTEHLEYCNSREWENNSFELEYQIAGDTLSTKGIEKIEEAGVDHMNIEKYVRLK